MTKHTLLFDHLGLNAQHLPMGAFMSFTCSNFNLQKVKKAFCDGH